MDRRVVEGALLGWGAIIFLTLGLGIIVVAMTAFKAFDAMGSDAVMCFNVYGLILIFLGALIWFMWWNYDVPKIEGDKYTITQIGYFWIIPWGVVCLWATWFVLKESRGDVRDDYYEVKPSQEMVLELERILKRKIDASAFDFSLDRQVLDEMYFDTNNGLGDPGVLIYKLMERKGEGVPKMEVVMKEDSRRYSLTLNTDRSSLYGYEVGPKLDRYKKDINCYLKVPIVGSGLPENVLYQDDDIRPFQYPIKWSPYDIYMNGEKQSDDKYSIDGESLVVFVNDELEYREKRHCLEIVWGNEPGRGTSMFSAYELKIEDYDFINKFVYPRLASDIYEYTTSEKRTVWNTWDFYQRRLGRSFSRLTK